MHMHGHMFPDVIPKINLFVENETQSGRKRTVFIVPEPIANTAESANDRKREIHCRERKLMF